MDFKEKEKQRRIRWYMNRCSHFRGIQYDTCKAGISMKDLHARRLPCIGEENKDPSACTHLVLPTREQAEQYYEETEKQLAETTGALRIVHNDAIANGLGQGHGGRGSVQCSTGCGGIIHYTVASVNGHIHALCDTEGCLSWME